MNRSTHGSQLQSAEYTFLYTGDTENEVGETVNITNEPSNYFAARFPEGYKVIGQKKHPTLNITYYFLTNPITGYSSFGYIENNIAALTFQEDTEVICEECDYYNILPTPLEDTVQTPYEEYTELLNDLCNKAFNFSINFPIKHIEIKVEKLGTKLYWVDNHNPDRWIDVDNIPYYRIDGFDSCGEDNETTVCVNVDKMLQEPNYSIPIFIPDVLQIGGNLRMGTYEFLGALCDKAGNEISPYFSITQPIRIFDENNRVLNQTELDSFTNFGIRIKVENLDEKFQYYKVVVVERVAVNQAESYFIEGIHSTSDTTIFYTATQTGTENRGGITERITIDRILSQKVKYTHTRGLMSSENTLYKWGLTSKKLPNLQPVVNFIGGFLKWNSSIAKETLYQDPIAAAKYLGYMREEVQPLGIRFFNKDGTEYPVLPLIHRPAKEEEIEVISPSDKNLISVLANGTPCTTTERNKRWQLYNTATVEGTCNDFNNSGQEIEETQTVVCIDEDIAELENSSVPIVVQDLKAYINANIASVTDPDSTNYLPEIAEYLTAEYPESSCTPTFPTGCDEPTLASSQVMVQEVVNVRSITNYNEDASSYPATAPPTSCSTFKQDSAGEYIPDEDFQTDYDLATVYVRNGIFQNEDCAYPETVINNLPAGVPLTGFYHNYYGADTQAELVDDDITISTTNANFFSNLHKGALWFKAEKNNRDKLLFEITKNSDCVQIDSITDIRQFRYSFFENCDSTSPISSVIISALTGEKVVVDVSDFPSTFYVSVEVPIIPTTNDKYRTAPPCGCFSMLTRDLQITGTTTEFDSMVFQNMISYQSECTYQLPEVNECKPIPYQYGDLAYWESTDTYPDNEELYNSSQIRIEAVDLLGLTSAQQQAFRTYYTTGVNNSVLTLNEDTDFRCKPIRHPKFPSNIISPFMGTLDLLPFSEALIFPLGINLDNEVVNTFLNIAVKNNLLTQQERDDIEGYEILKADNTLHKSIIANTVGFDMYKYTEKGKEVLYPNYPLNDLGEDMLQMEGNTNIVHPYNSNKNHNFSLMGADLSVNAPSIPSEIILSGYQFGNSRMYFQEVEDHPKYVVLTQGAINLAGILAGLEFGVETAFKIADYTVQAGQQYNVNGIFTGQTSGFITGFNTVGVTAGIGITAIIATSLLEGVGKIGQYRLQWLQTFENFGQPKNHTSYCAAEGYHNKFVKNQLSTELYRGISAAKYLKAGRFTFKDEHTGDTIRINNRDREQSVFMSVGEDHSLSYLPSYTLYDNNNLSQNNGSRTIVSQNGGQQGEEIIRNSALPYITLKNYIPNQYGTINSIKWLTTSYKKFLTEDTTCEIIYGGTVFLSRDVQRRKHPIFRTNAFGQADMTPFSYSNYKNVGTPRYYLDYKTGDTGGFLGTIFPLLKSDYTFDNETSNDLYFRSGSKFYLFYYGFASYLLESEINPFYRYGRTQLKDQYYPEIQGNMVDFTQEKNLSIKEPNTYFYNSVYSRPVTQTAYYTLPDTYSKKVYDAVNDSENGYIFSLPDNSNNDLVDPWLIYKPLNKVELDSKYGKLIALADLESGTILARFENTQLLLNAVDTIPTQNTAITVELGRGQTPRRLENVKTELGYGGTQNTEMLSTPHGHFMVDAKRGQVFVRSGQNLIPISDVIGNKLSGLKNWFKQQLPFKILKYFPKADIDNKYKGLGISMGYDNKLDRVFITKRDYKVIKTECLEYDDELGIVINDTACGEPADITCPSGYTYNETTQLCEKHVTSPICPDGYTYNLITQKCETQGTQTLLCPEGCTYDQNKNRCNCEEDTPQPCGEGCQIIMQPDGNAYCLCPSESVENLCVDCAPADNYIGCPDGYIYDEDLEKCVKTIPACPPYEGYYAGGTFTNPTNRIYNSENSLLSLFNGSVNVFHRDKIGRIYVGGGYSSTSEGTINRLIRFNFDGTIDSTFNIGTGFNATVRGIDSYSDGRVMVVGSFTTYQGVAARGIIRLQENGDKDTTFDNSIGFTGTDEVNVVKIVEGNKMLVGTTRANTYKGTLTKGIIKILDNGLVDTSFNGGNRTNSFVFDDTANGINGLGNLNGVIRTIEIAPDGGYFIGGTFNEYNGTLSRRIAKIKQDGDIDTSFSVGAGFNPNPASTYTWNIGTVVNKIQLQGSKLLVAGQFFTYKAQPAQAIARLDLNGSLDNSFNNDKNVGTLGSRIIYDFDTNVDGEILVGGQYAEYDNNGIANLTYTDINGFSISTPDEMFNSVIFAVLNTPRCIECFSDECTQLPLGFGEVQCQCPPQLIPTECECIDEVPPIVVDRVTPIGYDNEEYFEDASWTITFRPSSGWISYMPFYPDYYVNNNEYFQAGYNWGGAKETTWTHNMGLKSFQVFQGVFHPFIAEAIVPNEGVNKILSVVNVNSEVKRWHNQWDFSQWKGMGFTSAIVYNNTNNSGYLELTPQKTLADIRNYPQTLNNRQKILYTTQDNEHAFNYFYNRVKNQDNNLPVWRNDNNMILKTLNPQAISFLSKRVLERIKGEIFYLRMINDKESRLAITFKNTINSEIV